MHRFNLGPLVLTAAALTAACSSSSDTTGAATGGSHTSTGHTASGGSGGHSSGSVNPGDAGPSGGTPSSHPAPTPMDGGSTPQPVMTPDGGLGAGCETLCNTLDAAACPNQQSLNNCMIGCDLAINLPDCTGAYNALFDCVGNATATCNASGQAELSECATEQADALACIQTSAQSDPALSQTCANYCTAAVAANCTAGPATVDDCSTACSLAGVALPNCKTLWNGYLSCADGKAVTCDANGNATASGCQVQQLLFFLCASNAVPAAAP